MTYHHKYLAHQPAWFSHSCLSWAHSHGCGHLDFSWYALLIWPGSLTDDITAYWLSHDGLEWDDWLFILVGTFLLPRQERFLRCHEMSRSKYFIKSLLAFHSWWPLVKANHTPSPDSRWTLVLTGMGKPCGKGCWCRGEKRVKSKTAVALTLRK